MKIYNKGMQKICGKDVQERYAVKVCLFGTSWGALGGLGGGFGIFKFDFST